ncbi:MAG TPA: hypothetical protein VMG09_08020 [Bacteroidota bacterium]|nr:hypothetical protein [Bacteroidota bacterium]
MHLIQTSRIPSIAVLILTIATIGFAQPPAQGPPPPRPNDVRDVAMSIIINSVLIGIQQGVDSANAHIARDAHSTNITAHVSFSANVTQPNLLPTQNISTPNQNQIWNSFIVTYDVTDIRYHGVPYFDRQIGQTIDVFTRCDAWFTTHGALTTTTSLQPAYLDGPSFSEEALNFFIANTLTGLVDSKLRGSLPGAGGRIDTISIVPCGCLGLDPGSQANNYKDGAILFSLPPRKTVVTTNPAFNQASVTLQRIRRLQARGNGGILYFPSEDIRLDVYVNQALRSVEVDGLKEGDDRALNVQPVTFPGPSGNDMVVLIGNTVQHLEGDQTDSDFLVFNKAQNFGNGIQKLIIRKVYWTQPQQLPGGGISKPFKNYVDAYELTFLVSIPQQVFETGR